ncbi:NAD(P)/FAD-dependent oxidoreductase [Streptomyces sp. DSM 44917]|uniref:NAD(P)/FAD-dependent oxidoreductase n=1 Tax=Streptomyces boetiae TaxID=3075541 RepID=A0ABU2L2D0_9ACTN|nr:NAD(P)/FAD-dependent oxidoreductase [Streptomyces sp. DSM 44917]MDT0305720.1 NAD(P)/FAD-dependent oxidoreductase [Streptomyces sp. DSM 44917]
MNAQTNAQANARVAVRGDEESYDVLVVGGGAAGLSAALSLARARRRVAVVDDGSPRNAPAEGVHGFLSRDGMPPRHLLAAGRAEVTGYGGELINDRVTAVEPGFAARLASGRTLRARRLLVATGLRDELPEVPGLRERFGRDVLHCPYCHGHEVAGRALGVLGTQPLSAHQALLISQWSPDVTYFPGGPGGSAPTEEERARLAARGVRIAEGEVTGLALGEDGRLRGVRLAGDRLVPREALFVAPRFVPNDALLVALGCERNAEGWAVADPSGRTTAPGVWVAGNTADARAQVVTAASQGVAAAAALNQDLLEEDVTAALTAPAR